MKARFTPDGVHLFDKVSGLNILLDEIDVPKEQWSLGPRYVSIALTNACELSCSFCYAPKFAATLDFDRLCQWLVELDVNGCFGVGFGGGEPTLYKQLPDLCRFIRESTNLSVSFTTHGHWKRNNLANELKGNVDFIRISLDGIGEDYRKIRNKGYVEIKNLISFYSSVFKVGINFVLNRSTFKNLDGVAKVANELGASELLILPELSKNGLKVMDEKLEEDLKIWYSSYTGKLRLTISEAGEAMLPTVSPYSRSSGLQQHVHIDALGRVKASSFDEKGVKISGDDILGAIAALSK